MSVAKASHTNAQRSVIASPRSASGVVVLRGVSRAQHVKEPGSQPARLARLTHDLPRSLLTWSGASLIVHAPDTVLSLPPSVLTVKGADSRLGVVSGGAYEPSASRRSGATP